MNKRRSIIPILIAALLAMTAPAWGDELSNQDIERFIASMKQLRTMDDEFNALDDSADDENPMANSDHLMSEGLAKLKGHDLYNRVDSIVRDHGFASAEAWSRVGDRVLDAYVALQVKNQSGQVQQQMDEALRSINENPQLTPAQKEQMRAMMTQSMASMKSFADAPKADMDAIRPYKSQLDAVMDNNRQ